MLGPYDVTTKRWHFVVELDFRAFRPAADDLYEELTKRPSVDAAARFADAEFTLPDLFLDY